MKKPFRSQTKIHAKFLKLYLKCVQDFLDQIDLFLKLRLRSSFQGTRKLGKRDKNTSMFCPPGLFSATVSGVKVSLVSNKPVNCYFFSTPTTNHTHRKIDAISFKTNIKFYFNHFFGFTVRRIEFHMFSFPVPTCLFKCSTSP